LLHHAKDRTILYYSSDNPLFAGKSLYDTVKPVFLAGFSGIVIDLSFRKFLFLETG